jgi:predicted acylesterase/phospholipase RssA/CRP-like cAMP-binding protein
MQSSGARIHRLLEEYFELPPEEHATVLDQLDLVSLKGGEWLFRQGDPGDALYLLVRGRLQVWLEQDASGTLDPPRLIGGVAPGESVGEIALLTGAVRTAGIRANRDSQLLRVTRAAFERLAHRHPSLGLRLASRAALLVQQPAGAAAGSTRKLEAVMLMPLDATSRTAGFCEALIRELRSQETICAIARPGLELAGAPAPWPDGMPQAPDGLVAWLHRMEQAHRLLVFQCDPADPVWARFALRQSDLVILVGEAGSDPGLRDVERELGLDRRDSMLRRMLVLLQGDSTQHIENTSAWYRDRPLEFHLHVRSDRPDEVGRVTRVITGRATGLVLGAGASRGFAHLGVYRALCEAGVAIDWVGGTSIGAIMGATIAFDWGPQHATNVIRAAFVGGKPFSDYTVPLVSLLAGKRMRRLIGNHARQDIEDLPLPFFCISSRLDNGMPNVHRSGSLARALQATASMPGILPPTVVGGHLAVDGSVLNSLPVDLMWQQPVGRVIAVSLSTHRDLPVEYAETPGAWSILFSRMNPFGRRQRVPALVTVLLKATELATLRNVREQGGRASLLLQPEVRHFGLTEVRAFDRVVEAGYRCALEGLRRWSPPETA